MACKNANPKVVELLLQKGSNGNIMSYSNNAPMHNILKGVAFKLEHQPEIIVHSLLSYGSIHIWPEALPKNATFSKVPVHLFTKSIKKKNTKS
ncbi:UNVERIFIED_CONTAM: hypothetical protein FKN15_046323 [Acipenser sinensis]